MIELGIFSRSILILRSHGYAYWSTYRGNPRDPDKPSALAVYVRASSCGQTNEVEPSAAADYRLHLQSFLNVR